MTVSRCSQSGSTEVGKTAPLTSVIAISAIDVICLPPCWKASTAAAPTKPIEMNTVAARVVGRRFGRRAQDAGEREADHHEAEVVVGRADDAAVADDLRDEAE